MIIIVIIVIIIVIGFFIGPAAYIFKLSRGPGGHIA